MLGKVVILDRADKRYLILEGQKRYVELTPQMTGFNVPRTMTPGMMVEQLQRQPNVERVGEEQVANRTAVKYRVAGQAATGTPAGQVKGVRDGMADSLPGAPAPPMRVWTQPGCSMAQARSGLASASVFHAMLSAVLLDRYARKPPELLSSSEPMRVLTTTSLPRAAFTSGSRAFASR